VNITYATLVIHGLSTCNVLFHYQYSWGGGGGGSRLSGKIARGPPYFGFYTFIAFLFASFLKILLWGGKVAVSTKIIPFYLVFVFCLFAYC
jgi:hypothetical protein